MVRKLNTNPMCFFEHGFVAAQAHALHLGNSISSSKRIKLTHCYTRLCFSEDGFRHVYRLPCTVIWSKFNVYTEWVMHYISDVSRDTKSRVSWTETIALRPGLKLQSQSRESNCRHLNLKTKNAVFLTTQDLVFPLPLSPRWSFGGQGE